MSKIEQLLEKLKTQWKDQELLVREGASSAKLLELEARCRCHLPDDFRLYLTTVDGMGPDDLDERMLRYWPSEEISLLSTVAPESSSLSGLGSTLVFADALMHSAFYVLQTQSGQSAVFRCAGPLPELVTRSFTSFLELYLTSELAS